MKRILLVSFLSFGLISAACMADESNVALKKEDAGNKNLALKKEAKASDSYSSYVPSAANDGVVDFIKLWCCNSNKDVGAWWSVDLGETYKLTEVKIKYASHVQGKFTFVPTIVSVQVSSDNTKWTTVIDKFKNVAKNGEAYEDKFYSYPLPPNISGQYVKLVFDDGAGADDSRKIVGLVEVEVMGSK
ncbi:MAG: discoidin domain-containing protein [Lentisphaerota bacterium]